MNGEEFAATTATGHQDLADVVAVTGGNDDFTNPV
jgi:hypothetical protein